ncbi:anaphase-promoting complex subunit [Dunaliella salina]|uniref:Anaphase-promoting complex subunit n=1 Tax=Dunaliella salina TaxID=3046 RepID=A0ABQ7GER6_DUNSA|nr:anaphase-promoting complex subunit [Dunaliella salina]|eukprot:KAF5833089.1 anaphase-promoting complex subunit [Dunaliella salina]
MRGQVAVGDVVVDFCVSPVLASILAPFQHHEALTAEQLAAAVNLPVPLVRRRALFWVNHGILLGAYRRATVLHPSMHGCRVEDLGLEEDAPTQLPTAIDSLVLELGPYEPYIMGMLTNYGGLPLDRLHAMLKLFVVSPKYDKSTEQLAGFLSHLATQEKLIVDNGVWKKKPAPSKPSEN